MKPIIKKDSIHNIQYVESGIHEDSRGLILKYFSNNFNIKESTFTEAKKGSIRGMHFQINKPQTKMIFVIKGKILDVCIDLNEPKIFNKILHEKDCIIIGNNYAHGFQALEDSIVLMLYSEETVSDFSRGFSVNSKILENIWDKNLKLIISENDLNLKKYEQ